jgi:hypothetical protein
MEVPVEVVFAIGVFQFKRGHTAQTAWRFMRDPLGLLLDTFGLFR